MDNTQAADKLLSCFLSVRKQNTTEWMRGIAEDINEYCEATGDNDRVRFNGDGLVIVRSKETRNG